MNQGKSTHPSDAPKPPTDPGSAAALDDVLTALQKSFSRVSERSAEVPPNQARSLILGDVNFSLTLRLQPAKDRLLCKSEGDVTVTLNGVIHHDVRVSGIKKPKSE